MYFRKVGKECLKCKKQGLESIEIIKGNVAGYKCKNCGADYDAEVYHDWENKKHYWVGKLRNPDFWKLNNKTFLEGLKEMAEREKKGIPEYLDADIIEEINPASEKNTDETL